ncbi:uncharacterized protein LOC111583234 isoform X2 [Amphiprion ocellaris]|uniref:uncharacterized protein LOC111583234 isoform X2 n=1 Tax=Amphiprion ocellaris TaxID=80972 RepID=UPI0024117C7F|nr:uncharacterized protein LOC111583234 isoform X2 [Amphiprion ocellaris]
MQTMDSKSKLRATSALVFHTVLILLVARFYTGEAVGQHQLVEASIGITGDVMLPCHVEPATDATDELLEWSRQDLNPRFIHVRRDGEDHLVDQNTSYMNRTSVSVDGLKQGNMSLRLSRVRLSDEATYRCFSPRLKTDSRVQLVVAAAIEITKDGAGVLKCKSAGWYPEPEVLWLDAEGNLLSAGPTETVRGPDDLYTVSSRVTVEKKHGNNFTCRVQQNNEHRDTKFHIADDFFTDPSVNSAILAVIGLILFVLVVLVFALFAWRQNKINTKKNPEDEESQSEEKKPLMKSEKETQHNIGGTQQEPRTLQEQCVERGDAESVSTSIKTETANQNLMNENVKETLTEHSDTAAQKPTKGEESPEDPSAAETKTKNTKKNPEDEESRSVDSEEEIEQHKEEENNTSVPETSQKIVDSSINGQQQSDEQSVKSGTTPESEMEPGRQEDEDLTDEENTENQTTKQNQEESENNVEGTQSVETKPDGEQKEAGATEPRIPQEKRNDVDKGDAENVSTSMTAEPADQSQMNESKEETSADNSDTAAQKPTKGEESPEDPSAAETKIKSEETPSSSSADENNGKDELPTDTKIPEINIKNGVTKTDPATRESEEAKHPES